MTPLRAEDRRGYLFDRVAHSAREALASRDEVKTVSVAIATVRFDLITRDPELERRLRRYFASYLAGGPTLAELHVEPLAPPAGLEEIWEDPSADFHERGNAVVQRDFAAIRNPRRPGHPNWSAFALVNPRLDDAFHNLLRWFAPDVLLSRGCLLLHGAGAAREGHGYAFFGQSGAGKSTSAGMIADADAEAVLLGDDAVIVQVDGDGRAMLHSAPLGCGYTREAPRNVSVPLLGLYRLMQSNSHRIEPLEHSGGVATLLASAMNTMPDQRLEERFDLAQRFAETGCGIHALHFARDAAFWPLVLETSRARTPARRPHAKAP